MNQSSMCTIYVLLLLCLQQSSGTLKLSFVKRASVSGLQLGIYETKSARTHALENLPLAGRAGPG
jgi:hypothetical protein